ncbi:IclR family transcriptional regulator [Breoghania corrubedonensis]|uniref:IclR family transcriptional regulator n=1 Tax=Breoghania corrubedonensis TaxID=665038 RepID=A0A2T5VGP4_9HYPH|nr:IclR family transcriptional regulator C-terminal domain-containing protein [Breoghania corrubedonensis]PTW62927.1 IclR family transcriptional regulator [Breoghania corrubedonensis]
MPSKKQDTLFVASLAKGLTILHAFGQPNPEMSLAEIVRVTGLDKSACQRLTNTLFREGFLLKDPITRRFRPSLKCLEMAAAYAWADPLVRLMMPKLIDLGHALGERVNAARLDGPDIVYIIRIPTQLTSFGGMIVGRRLPALTTSAGRAMISRLAPDARREAIETWPLAANTHATELDRGRIAERIEEAAGAGFAVAVGQNIINEIAVAAPVMARDGTPVAAVQCSVSAPKWTAERVTAELAPQVLDVANSFNFG